jgi:hypothetical protein
LKILALKPDEDDYQQKRQKLSIASGIYGPGTCKSVQKKFLTANLRRILFMPLLLKNTD